MERIITASSIEDDIVYDPFCDCGTTAAVSRRINRRSIGIDISTFLWLYPYLCGMINLRWANINQSRAK